MAGQNERKAHDSVSPAARPSTSSNGPVGLTPHTDSPGLQRPLAGPGSTGGSRDPLQPPMGLPLPPHTSHHSISMSGTLSAPGSPSTRPLLSRSSAQLPRPGPPPSASETHSDDACHASASTSVTLLDTDEYYNAGKTRPKRGIVGRVTRAIQRAKEASQATGNPKGTPMYIASLIMFWIICGSVNGISQKSVLQQFKYPASLSALQLTVGFVMSAVRLYYRDQSRGYTEHYSLALQLQIFPLCMSQTLASMSNNISVSRVSVALTQIVKSLTSVGTVIFSYLLLDRKSNHFSLPVLLSLVPIIAGVSLSSYGDVNFEIFGFLASITATMLLSFQGVATKRLYQKHDLEPLTVQYICSKIACLLAITSWALSEASHLWSTGLADTDLPTLLPPLILHLGSHYSQVTVAFLVMDAVHPLTYQVSNTFKRFCLIVASLYYFDRPVTTQFVLGFATALIGMTLYSVLKYHAARGAKARAAVKTTSSGQVGNTHAHGQAVAGNANATATANGGSSSSSDLTLSRSEAGAMPSNVVTPRLKRGESTAEMPSIYKGVFSTGSELNV